MTDHQTIPTAVILDPRLSLHAKGLLAMLMAHSATEGPLTEAQLRKHASSGRELYRTAMGELESLGFVERQMVRERGRITGFTMAVRV